MIGGDNHSTFCFVDQIISIKDTMKKIKMKPRIATDFMVDSLLRSKLRVGDELAPT